MNDVEQIFNWVVFVMTCGIHAYAIMPRAVAEVVAGVVAKVVTYSLGAPHLKHSSFLAKLCIWQAPHAQSPGFVSVFSGVKPSQPFSMKNLDLSLRFSELLPSWSCFVAALEGCSRGPQPSFLSRRLASGLMAFCSRHALQAPAGTNKQAAGERKV